MGIETRNLRLVPDMPAHFTDAHQQMYAMISSYWVSQSIRAFADLSLADHLAAGPLTAAEVATRESSAPETTLRLMRAGVTLGMLTVDDRERFSATALLHTLRTGTRGSLRGMAIALTDRAHWLPWSEFAASVRQGRSNAQDVLGTPFFEYVKKDATRAQEFTDAMQGFTELLTPDVAANIDTTGVKTAIDVGGATGSLLQSLQQANPALRGIVFDRPDVAAAIAPHTADDRTDVIGGDFFESVPPGDLYLLKSVLHDWPNQGCVQILTQCRKAMNPDGRIVIVEMMVGDDSHPQLTAMMDLNMLATMDSKERTLAEFDALLSEAGLRRTALTKPESPYNIIEAVAT
jgi:hypothetical protein